MFVNSDAPASSDLEKKFYICTAPVIWVIMPARKEFLKSGDIAQLARACDWQSQGQGFDSPYLHKVTNFQLVIKRRNL